MPTTLQEDFILAQRTKRFGVPDIDARWCRHQRHKRVLSLANIAMAFSIVGAVYGDPNPIVHIILAQAPQEKRLRDEQGRIDDDPRFFL